MADENTEQAGSKQQGSTSRPDQASEKAPTASQQGEQANRSLVQVKSSAPTEQTTRTQGSKQTRQAVSGRRPVIVVRNLSKTYGLGRQVYVHALRGVSLDVYPGEFVAVMGPSGSGKTTFMNLLGCLDTPTAGQYWLAGKLVSHLSSDELALIRNRMIGFVFQGFNLLGRATALANVELPMVYAGLSRRERERRAFQLLRIVGIASHAHHKPAELSGGQQQRVAIARALANGPAVLLADEPTGNLDSRTGLEIMAVMQALNAQGLTIVLVTHDANIASFAKRRLDFLDGRLVNDELVREPRSAQQEWLDLLHAEAQGNANVQIKEEQESGV